SRGVQATAEYGGTSSIANCHHISTDSDMYFDGDNGNDYEDADDYDDGDSEEEGDDEDDEDIEMFEPQTMHRRSIATAHLHQPAATGCTVYVCEMVAVPAQHGTSNAAAGTDPVSDIVCHWELREVSTESKLIRAYAGSYTFSVPMSLRNPRLRTGWINGTDVLVNAHDADTGRGLSFTHRLPITGAMLSANATSDLLWSQVYGMSEMCGFATLQPIGPVSRMLVLMPIQEKIPADGRMSAGAGSTATSPIQERLASCQTSIIDISTGLMLSEYRWPSRFEHVKQAVGRTCHLIVPRQSSSMPVTPSAPATHPFHMRDHCIVDAVTGQVYSRWPVTCNATDLKDMTVSTTHITYTIADTASTAPHAQLVVFDFAFDCY
ncbi:hypothetical protein THASP1DRAFT_21924, partial [Thamnocephalis sphaerospora]